LNNYDFIVPRQRRKSLFIVEGNHEKNELIRFLLLLFPEIDIRDEDIMVYGTNIYMLYEDIAKEYGADWDTQDVDLAYVVSRKKAYEVPLRKDDFNNIVLIFDYERHDPNFAEDKISRIQSYFCDSTDVGKLYINYPMVESYRHFEKWPDEKFATAEVSVGLQPGSQYKRLVENTFVSKVMAWFDKANDVLLHKFEVHEEMIRRQMVESMIHMRQDVSNQGEIATVVSNHVHEEYRQEAGYLLFSMLEDLYEFTDGEDYYSFTRRLFVRIIRHNIYKTNQILHEEYALDDESIRGYYDQLLLEEVLDVQNVSSRNLATGVIAVLNTSVFFVPDYNFKLIQE